MEEGQQKGFKNLGKLYLGGFIVFGIVLVLVIIVSMFFQMQGDEQLHDGEDDGASESEELLNSVYVTFENGYQLDYSVGKTTASKLLIKTGEIIGDIEETEGGKSGIVEAEILETSFKKNGVNSGFGYSFDVQVIDGWKYQVWIRTDVMYGNGYYCCLVNREGLNEGMAYLTIAITSEDTDDVKREETIKDLSAWAKELLPGKNIVLNVTEL